MRTMLLGSMLVLVLSGCLTRSRDSALAAAREALPCPSLMQDAYSARLDQQADARWNESATQSILGGFVGVSARPQEVGAPRRRVFKGCGVLLQCDVTYPMRDSPRATCVRIEPEAFTAQQGGL